MAAALPGIPAIAVSLMAVLLLAAAHSLSVQASGNFQVVITTLKVGLISALFAWDFSEEAPCSLLQIKKTSGWSFTPLCRLADVCLVCLLGLERCRIHH